jgi:hypothetical protein
MTSRTRQQLLKDFKDTDKSVLSNARCLTEGIDVPAIDCVFFCDPKSSVIDIVQATGRALRPSKGKRKGIIAVPVYHTEKDNVEDSVSKSSFDTLVNVVRAMSLQDETLAAQLNSVPRDPDGQDHSDMSMSKFISMHDVSNRLCKSLFTQVVSKTRDQWESMYNELLQFKEDHPGEWPTRKDHGSLGMWCSSQRAYRSRGSLSKYRQDKLNDINFIWDTNDHKFYASLTKLESFVRTNPNRWPDSTKPEERQVALWLERRRNYKRSNQLVTWKDEAIDKIAPGWFTCTRAQWWSHKVAELESTSPELLSTMATPGLKVLKKQISAWHRNGQYPERVKKALELGVCLASSTANPEAWFGKYNELKAYLKTAGRWPSTRSGNRKSAEALIAHWVSFQRRQYRDGKLSGSRIKLLTALDMVWDNSVYPNNTVKLWSDGKTHTKHGVLHR